MRGLGTGLGPRNAPQHGGMRRGILLLACSFFAAFFAVVVLLHRRARASFTGTFVLGYIENLDSKDMAAQAAKEDPASHWEYRPNAFDYKPLGPEFTDEPWWEQFDSNRTIYVATSEGTCNMMWVFSSALTYAYKNKVNVKFLSLHGSTWQDLFEFPNISMSSFPEGTHSFSETSVCEKVVSTSISNLAESTDLVWKKNPYGDDEIACIRTCCWKEEPVLLKTLWLFRILKPIPMLRQIIHEFVAEKEWWKYDMIGVHIRRTDNLKNGGMLKLLERANARDETRHMFDTTNADTIFPLENYVARMKQMNESRRIDSLTGRPLLKPIRFFLASDNDEARDYILSQFDEGVVHTFERNVTGDRLRKSIWGIQLGMIDLFLLSSCKAIIGTPYSSFTLVASWISGIPRFDVDYGLNKTTERLRSLEHPEEPSIRGETEDGMQ